MTSAASNDALFRQAANHFAAGRLQPAGACCQQILASAPLHADALNLLGAIQTQLGRPTQALDVLRRAIAIHPRNADYHIHLAMALAALQQMPAAVDAVRESLRSGSTRLYVLVNAGHILRQAGELTGAVHAYESACNLAPRDTNLLFHLANARSAAGDKAQAIATFRRALELKPDDIASLHALGNELAASGDFDEAITLLQQATQLNPRAADVRFNLAQAMLRSQRFEEALASAQRAIELSPEVAYFHFGVGVIFELLDRKAEARDAYATALQLQPGFVDALNNLACLQKSLGELDAALENFNRATTLRPDYLPAIHNAANVLRETGKIDEAVALCRQAVARSPANASLLSSLIVFLLYAPGDHSAEWRSLYAQWNERFAAKPDAIQSHPNLPDSSRRLRIGYLSPDLRDHAVGWFMLPLLQHHDPAAVELFCYSNAPREDAWTQKLRAPVPQWRNVYTLSDQALAEQIRADEIDILVDLALHLPGGRLQALSRKPAPIQVAYLGYAGPTGLAAFDYRLTDPQLDPPASESSLEETPVRLPNTFWCYAPPERAGPVAPPPSLSNGQVTFGSFNTFAKVSNAVLETWAELLRRVSRSRLLLHTPPGSHRAAVLEQFATKGVTGDRIDFFAALPIDEYFAAFARIDVALDSFPFAGGTTTCDTLWMGVPVVTLRGAHAHERGGASILSNVGLSDLIADSLPEYLDRAASLAADADRRVILRSTLRERMLSSPLMNAKHFAVDVESAYRSMWRTWCSSRSHK